jgi:hypothetical protein
MLKISFDLEMFVTAFRPFTLYHSIPGPDNGNSSSGSSVTLFAALIEGVGMFPGFSS